MTAPPEKVLFFVCSGIFLEDSLQIIRELGDEYACEVVSLEGLTAYRLDITRYPSHVSILRPFVKLRPFASLAPLGKLRQASSIKTILKGILDPPPRWIFIDDDTQPANSMIVQQAKRHGIFVILAVPGLLFDFEQATSRRVLHSRGLLASAIDRSLRSLLDGAGVIPRRRITGLGGADTILVPGRHSKNVLVRRGVPSTRIHTVGLWRYRPLQRLSGMSTLRPKRLILYAGYLRERYGSACLAGEDFLVLSALAGISRTIDLQYEVVIKPHPMERTEDYDPIVESLPDHRLTVTHEPDIKKLLPETCVLITFYSTAMVEAMLFGALVVVLDPEDQLKGLDLVKVSHPDGLVPTVTSFIENPEIRKRELSRQKALLAELLESGSDRAFELKSILRHGAPNGVAAF